MFSGDILADGQLPSSLGTLYTVSAGEEVYVKFFTCYNTSASSQNVYAYIKPNASSRCIGRAELAQYETVKFIGLKDGVVLTEGDTIEGYASDANVVDYVISGVVKT